jgi:DNA-binding NarL/FixJ family response regulator
VSRGGARNFTGAPSITEAQRALVRRLLARGLTQRVAAQQAGISVRSVKRQVAAERDRARAA